MDTNNDNLIALGHMDIIHEGDIVFDDFGKPRFKVGINHARIGTEYNSMFDMPTYRLKAQMPTRLTA